MCHYNIRKYSFCARVVNMWNSLPNDVVEADTVNTFKNRLDKHWYNQDVLFDFNADLIGTGSIPICMWSNVCKMWAKRTTCARLNALDWIGLDYQPNNSDREFVASVTLQRLPYHHFRRTFNIFLARTHQKIPLDVTKTRHLKWVFFWEEFSPDPSPSGEGYPSPHPTLRPHAPTPSSLPDPRLRPHRMPARFTPLHVRHRWQPLNHASHTRRSMNTSPHHHTSHPVDSHARTSVLTFPPTSSHQRQKS